MKALLKLCRDIRRLSDEELNEAARMATEQMGYMHPLKHATQDRMRRLGAHNLSVVSQLRTLRDQIVRSEELR